MVTEESFSWLYGYAEVRAKMPRGDWIWPGIPIFSYPHLEPRTYLKNSVLSVAIWFLPTDYSYGGWPRSGEIDLVEIRGNNDLSCGGYPLGNRLMGSTLHWGPDSSQNAYYRTHWEKYSTVPLSYTPNLIK